MMNKSIALTLAATFLMTGMTHVSRAQATPSSQPTPSMQEQYDKLHGTKPKPATPQKSKTAPAQKPAKATAPKPEVVEKPKAAPKEEGGFKFSAGVKGGANYSTFSKTESQATGVKLESILGYHGGLILNLGTETFSVQPEILYSQVGGKITAAQNGLTLIAEAKINTITVPVLLKLALGGEKVKVFVNAGGYGTYALNAKGKATLNGQTSTSDIKYEKGDPRIEYGAVGGAGVSLGLGAAKLLIEGRYYYGLGSDDKDTPKANKSFVNNIQGSIGILIPIGG